METASAPIWEHSKFKVYNHSECGEHVHLHVYIATYILNTRMHIQKVTVNSGLELISVHMHELLLVKQFMNDYNSL